MISLIIGNKGAGKTKTMVAMVNKAVEDSLGNIVCVEKKPNLTFNVNSRARLLDTDYYHVAGCDAFYGFLSGICAGNYDVTDIFVDATLKIIGRDYAELVEFMKKLKTLSEFSETNFIFTVSEDKDKLPAELFEVCKEI